eukprot:CAMPEP_0180164418 /NCGR_PEP_ID=MMETSP0986-20121125/30369_1 /TAXON_ID=697907 /ORGANISM="non described non described, Strain CCMP2293" /LENGTH=75 /DNA_ID=CAMNT_0022115213 /DNA_START=54 /DNA_END=278 /DNA_ORIENTATION=+
MEPASAATPGEAGGSGSALSTEDLLTAIRGIKEGNPEFGIKRVWSTLKENNGLDVSEKRVKKVMQENGLTDSAAG